MARHEKTNYWLEQSSALIGAYTKRCQSLAGFVRFNLVTRAVLDHLSAAPQRIVDVGGGFGQQGLIFAREGHSVIIVDPDPAMLATARNALAAEKSQIRARVQLVHGRAENAVTLVGGDFDLVCCHSVLLYLTDLAEIVHRLVELARPGGLISILCINGEAIAMRSGLQRLWGDAIASLTAETQIGDEYLECKVHTRDDVIAALNSAGAVIRTWHGVCVFTDHLTGDLLDEAPGEDQLTDIVELEWLAGARDPYRQIARCFHLIAERRYS